MDKDKALAKTKKRLALAKPANAEATRLIQIIHVAAKQLGIDADTRKARQQALTGKASTADMTVAELLTVKRWLESLGWRPTPAAKHGPRPAFPAGCERLGRKIEALLADAKRPWSYLLDKGKKDKSMLEKLTGKQALRFCTAEDLRKVVQALEVDKQRRATR